MMASGGNSYMCFLDSKLLGIERDGEKMGRFPIEVKHFRKELLALKRDVYLRLLICMTS